MASLFERLEKRDSQEDFFTEAFCYVLDKNREVLKEYIKFLIEKAFPEVDPVDESIETQRRFAKGRPDVIITFYDNKKQRFMIICEHKIRDEERGDQLKRYFKILQGQEINGGVLALITDYHVSATSLNKYGEDVDYSSDFIKQEKNIFALTPLRWSYMHTKLKEWEELVKEPQKEVFNEFLKYMEELGMEDPKKFTALELAELSRIPKLIRALDECLEHQAWREFQSIKTIGNISYETGWHLKEHSRWVYCKPINTKPGKKLKLFMGIYLDADKFNEAFDSDEIKFDDPDYPELLIWLECKPTIAMRDKYITYCKKLSDTYKADDLWKFIKSSKSLALVIVHKSMKDFIHYDENQIEEIQKWFAKHLGELKEFMDKNEIPSEA